MKYRFQNLSPNVRYRSTFHALVTIAREERLRGLFKGISSPLVRLAIPPQAVYWRVSDRDGVWRSEDGEVAASSFVKRLKGVWEVMRKVHGIREI